MNQIKKIAIVDDDDDLLKLLAHSFNAKGFEVETFSTGKQAYEFFSEEKNCKDISLLVLDRLLPDMDGLDVLKLLEKKCPQHMPVLILSVLTTEKDVLSGLKLGAVDYVGKPFSIPVLIQKALALIEK